MTFPISERALEDASEAALLRHGQDEIPGDTTVVDKPATFGDPWSLPVGSHRRRAEDYERELCLLPNDVVDFILATQPKEWGKLSQHYGARVKERHLRRLLPPDRDELPREVQRNIDMESYRVQQTRSGSIRLDRRTGVLDPIGPKNPSGPQPEEIEALSRIIAELNQRFGLNLGPEHRVTLGQMMEKLASDAALDAAARVNTPENVRLTFDHKVEQVIQEIVDSNFDLYKRITDDQAFGEVVKNLLFDQYVRGHRNADR